MSEQKCCELNHLMSRILEVRYTGLKEEKELCGQLLERAEKEKDSYAQVFAYTFLGDYYIAMNEVDAAGDHLLKALAMCEDGTVGEYDDVRLRIYSLLGIYYEHKGDEQSSIQYYLYADAIARYIGDTLTECQILNNIAFSFQRHNGTQKALEFYQEAYDRQEKLETSPIRLLLISNLVEILIDLGRMDEAKVYIGKYEQADGDPQEKERLRRGNMCLYCAKLGDKEACLKWTEEILANLESVEADPMMAFENYTSFFEAMMDIGHREYAKKFLTFMERSSGTGGIDQKRILEKKRIQYCIEFEEESLHHAAYERFYTKMQEFKSETDKTITSAMKTMIYLRKLRKSTEKLRDRHDDLTRASVMDELTGIYNRGYFDNAILQYSQEPGSGSFAVIMIDVDYFKEYNDFYKHYEGDKVLMEVAACLRDNQTEGISPCRYGGDEFVCVCSDIGRDAVVSYIDSVRACIAQKAIRHEKSACSDIVTLSIGFAIGKRQEDAVTIMEAADRALYDSKNAGRNTVSEKQVSVDE